jgi:hypothetical protein
VIGDLDAYGDAQEHGPRTCWTPRPAAASASEARITPRVTTRPFILVSNNAYRLTSVNAGQARRRDPRGSPPCGSAARATRPRFAWLRHRGSHRRWPCFHRPARGRKAARRRERSLCARRGTTVRARAAVARGPIGETRLQFVERIADAYGLVLLLILATFVLTVTLPPEGGPAVSRRSLSPARPRSSPSRARMRDLYVCGLRSGPH